MTTKSSGKVTADEIIDLVYSLKRPYRKNAVFLANDACVAELRKLKDSTGQYLCCLLYTSPEQKVMPQEAAVFTSTSAPRGTRPKRSETSQTSWQATKTSWQAH